MREELPRRLANQSHPVVSKPETGAERYNTAKNQLWYLTKPIHSAIVDTWMGNHPLQHALRALTSTARLNSVLHQRLPLPGRRAESNSARWAYGVHNTWERRLLGERW
jgi:hypothetical protein